MRITAFGFQLPETADLHPELLHGPDCCDENGERHRRILTALRNRDAETCAQHVREEIEWRASMALRARDR